MSLLEEEGSMHKVDKANSSCDKEDSDAIPLSGALEEAQQSQKGSRNNDFHNCDPKVLNLLRNNEISPLTIPQYYGFERRIHEFGDVDGTLSSVCYYKINDVELRNPEDMCNFLLETKLDIPISLFSFEPDVRTHIIIKPDQLKMNIMKADISEGLELVPVSVSCPAAMADTTEPLAAYCSQYIKDETLKTSLDHDDEFLACCDCSDNCRDKLKCACFLKTLDNCSEQTRISNGVLNIGYKYKRLEQPFLSGIFECNRRCKCKNTCLNRVAQNGIYCKLQIFNTINKGWGVRTLHDIPKGTFVCNYVGKIVSGKYADRVSKNLDDGKWKYLTVLSVGEENKEGYEADVIIEPEEPEDASTVADVDDSYIKDIEEDSQVTPNSEAEQLQQQHDEWEDTIINDPNVSSSTPESTYPRKNQDNVSLDEIENDTVDCCDSQSQRFSVEGLTAISLWNGMVKRRSLCVLGGGKRRVGKVSRARLLGELTSKNFALKASTENRHPTPLPALNQNIKKRMEMASHILPSLMKLDPSIVSSSSPSLALCKQKTIKIKRDRVNRKASIKTPTRRTKMFKDAWIWQKPRYIYKQVRKSPKRRANPFLIKSYRRRRSQSGLSKKGITNNSKTLHKLLRFELNVDGMDTGNVGRYFNHSCDPNLFPQYVFTDNHDLRLPQISLFALKNIRAGEELTWNYNYAECDEEEQQEQNLSLSAGSSSSSPMKKKSLTRMSCFCGADNCRKRLC